MLHWPDSMFTYLVEDKILMPNDAFGQHLASSGRFDDEVDQTGAYGRSSNVLRKHPHAFCAAYHTKKIQEVVAMKTPNRDDCAKPRHHLAKRPHENRQRILGLEHRQNRKAENKVVVFDTMWGSTDKMARAIADGVISQGVEVKLLKLRGTDNTEVVTEIVDAKAVLVGFTNTKQRNVSNH